MMNFDEIYRKYNKVVFRCIMKIVRNEMDAEELTSETMIRVHKSLGTYREELAKLSTWIINIGINAAIDHVRKKRLNTVSIDEVYKDWANGDEASQIDHLVAIKTTELNPEERMISNETGSTMFEKFNDLSEVDRLIASLHYFDGLSYDEVAAHLRMPLGTIKAKLHKARVKLMDAFPEEMRKLSTIER